MTGLLRSLGAQALDHAPALRPAARLRGAAAIHLDSEQESEPAARAGAIVRASVAPSADRPASNAAAAIVHRDAKPVREAAEVARDERRPAEGVRAHEGAAIAVARHDPADRAERTVHAEAAVREAARERAHRDVPPRPPAPASTMGTRITAQRPGRPEPRSRTDESFAALARQAHEPPHPDVQIHIGRIELTAITSPASSAPRAAPQAKKPMSLDEYLRGRTRRTPT